MPAAEKSDLTDRLPKVVKTTPSVMHKCQAVIVGPQDHEIELIVAILEIVNTPPGDTSPSAPRARAGAVA